MKGLLQTAVLFASLASCAGTSGSSAQQVDETRLSTKVSFAREGFEKHFPVLFRDGKKALEVSCYSLDDTSREEFASNTGTDPVADLSCYVKDIRRNHEYTMLGIDGESLQFTPAFFWFSDVSKCAPKSYRLTASLRGIEISFDFSHIDRARKTSDLSIYVHPMASATNDRLTAQSFNAGCK